MEYGYCDQCRDFHAAQADFNSDTYTRAPVMGGGWMRCCGDSLRAWVVYHPAPWEPGLTVRCIHTDDPFHAMTYCACGHWHWCRAMCAEAGQ